MYHMTFLMNIPTASPSRSCPLKEIPLFCFQMKQNTIPVLLLALTLSIGFAGCSGELLTPECDGSTPTYDGEVKTLIDANCTSSGCHGFSSSRGDYTTYAGIEADLNNGKFEREVLKNQSMPQDGSLTQAEINTVQCWLDNGFAEN